MSEPRLKTGLWVTAAVRALSGLGVAATVVRKGDADAGAVLLKQNFLDGRFRVLSRALDGTGVMAWHAGTGDAPADEAKADAYIAREIDRDYDLWVIEIEDRSGRLPFAEPFAPGV